MKSIRIVWAKRLGVYILGLFVLALGIAFSVKSNLGVSPVTSVPLVLSRITGLTLGVTTAMFYLLCMAIQAAVLRREYKLINLFQIAVTFIFGYFTDAALLVVSFLPVSDHLIVRFIYLSAGITCIALGVMLYLTAALISLPTDGTVQAIAYRGGIKLHVAKNAYDGVLTALALALSLAVLRGIDGLGVGTVVAAVGVGRLLGLFMRLFRARLERFLNRGDSETESGRFIPLRAKAKKAS